jgi:hypothetical protein
MLSSSRLSAAASNRARTYLTRVHDGLKMFGARSKYIFLT